MFLNVFDNFPVSFPLGFVTGRTQFQKNFMMVPGHLLLNFNIFLKYFIVYHFEKSVLISSFFFDKKLKITTTSHVHKIAIVIVYKDKSRVRKM